MNLFSHALNTLKGNTMADTNEIPEEATKAPVKKTAKAPAKPKAPTKAPAKAKPTAKTKAPAEAPAKAPTKAEPEAKPDPVTIDGFEVKATEDEAKAIRTETEAVAKAVQAIADKESDLLGSYLTLGKFASTVAPKFKSTKLYGQYLAKAAPASQTLDAPLRSNCKWLYEALNVTDADGSDILSVLGINRIEDYKSGNPTVIKRHYKEAIKKAEKVEKYGTEDEEAIKEAEDKEKSKDEANAKRKVTKSVKNLIHYVNAQPEKADALAELEDILKEMFNTKKGLANQIEFLADLK